MGYTIRDTSYEGMMSRAITAIAALFLLTACGGGQDGLHDMRGSGDGPDEFAVLPTAPLQMPARLDSLPPPRPGMPNRVDPDPRADAIVALGGRPGAAHAGGIPAADQALVVAASRHGVAPGIRATVAAEDAAFRRGAGRMTLGLFGGDRYFRAYSGQKLDAYAELARLRALGIETPTAPPAAR